VDERIIDLGSFSEQALESVTLFRLGIGRTKQGSADNGGSGVGGKSRQIKSHTALFNHRVMVDNLASPNLRAGLTTTREGRVSPFLSKA